MIKINANLLQGLVNATSIKTTPLRKGDVCTTVGDVIEGVLTNAAGDPVLNAAGGTINTSYITVAVEGSMKRVPLVELANAFSIQEGGKIKPLTMVEGDSKKGEIVIPSTFKIEDAQPMTRPNGDPLYALTHYEKTLAELNAEGTNVAVYMQDASNLKDGVDESMARHKYVIAGV